MKFLLAVFIILSCKISVASDNNTEKLMELAILTIADYNQSAYLLYDTKTIELNPMLSDHPDRVSLATFGIVSLSVTYFLSANMKKPWRDIFLDSVIASERMNVEENERMRHGLGRQISAIPIIISFRWN